MNKEQFILELISIYDDFTEKNTQARVKAYNVVLSNDIDFDNLLEYTLKHHESLRYAPSPAFLYNATFKMKEEVYNPYM